jgi:hypothetical protein
MVTVCNAEAPDTLIKTVNHIKLLSNVTDGQRPKEEPGSTHDLLIIDNTITSKGRQFYDWFYSNWYTFGHDSTSFLTINEKVVSRQRSIISISIDECVVSRFSLSTKDSDFEQIGNRQIVTVSYFLRHPESMDNQIFENNE